MQCKITRITKFIDGDSFEAVIAAEGYEPIQHGVRLKGIDCPDFRAKCKREKRLARKASAFTKKMLLNAKVIQIQTAGLGFYERILGTVLCDGVSLNQRLLDVGLAQVYSGYKKSWCN